MTHDDFPNVELHAVKRWFKVIKQGPPGLFFDDVRADNDVNKDRGEEEEVEVENPATTSCMHNFSQIDLRDIGLNMAAEEGNYEIDDYNVPAPENNPSIPDNNMPVISAYSTKWGHQDFCTAGVSRRRDRLFNHSPEILLTALQLFEILFPIKWLKETVLHNLNDKIEEQVAHGELLRFLGM